MNAIESMTKKWEEKNKTFYLEAKPLTQEDSCIFENLRHDERCKVMMLSCNCSKCTFR
jgi:hypothetical protein